MKRLDPEVVREGLIDSFEFILELDKNPEMLRKLPKKSVMIKKGDKRLFVSAEKEPKVIML